MSTDNRVTLNDRFERGDSVIELHVSAPVCTVLALLPTASVPNFMRILTDSTSLGSKITLQLLKC